MSHFYNTWGIKNTIFQRWNMHAQVPVHEVIVQDELYACMKEAEHS
jgi:hypothetical protein